jgi:hypothetical protein
MILRKEISVVLAEARRRMEIEQERFVAAATGGNVEEALAAAKAWREALEIMRAVSALHSEINGI